MPEHFWIDGSNAFAEHGEVGADGTVSEFHLFLPDVCAESQVDHLRHCEHPEHAADERKPGR